MLTPSTYRFRLLALLTLVALAAPTDAHAQFGRLGAAVRRAGDRATDAAIDAAGRRAGDAAEAAVAGAGTDAGYADDAPAPSAHVLFATAFAADAAGAFPRGFSPGTGTFAVTSYRGHRALRAASFGEIHVELPHDLPEAFTLEFDLAAPMGWTQRVLFQERPLTSVALAPDRGGLDGNGHAVSQPTVNAGAGRFFPVRIVVDGERVRVYHSRTLVANVPAADVGRSNRLTFGVSASQAHPVFLANVRLTTDGPPEPTDNPNYPGR